MRISTKTRYGARALFELARAWPHGPVSVREIAALQNISTKYLESIIATLRAADIIRSFRGVDGGYTLSRPPDEIQMSEVFRALEGSPAIVDCVDHPQSCPHCPECPTRNLWTRVSNAVSQVLEATTLQDLIDTAPTTDRGHTPPPKSTAEES